MSANTNVGRNGLDSELKPPPLRKLADLREESRRLRLELLHRTIDVTLTIAGFPAAWPQNKQLRLTSVRMAREGYERVLAMLESAPPPENELQEFRQRLDELRHAISDGDSPAPAAAQAPPTPAREAAVSAALEPLTSREREVLRCIASGYRTKDVARILGMSSKTAACHRYRLMEKLAIHDTANLVRYAIREGIVKV